MFIKTLSLRNFRNFKSTTLTFKKECVNTIVGENSSGKTNIFEAMRLILDDTLPYYKRYLSENDFHRGLGAAFGHWVIVSLEFDEIGGDEESELLCQLNTTVNGGGTGRITYIYRPQFYIREQLFKLNEIADYEARKSAYHTLKEQYSIDKTTYESSVLCQGTADFSDNQTYSLTVGDFDTLLFSDPRLERINLIGNRQRNYNIQDNISCTYARALRDVVSELKNNRFNPFQKLLEYVSKGIDNDATLSENIRDVNERISSIDEVKKLSDGISLSITNAVGTTYSPVLNVTSELPCELKELVKVLQLKAGDSLHEGYVSELSEMSLGGANLIYLALKLYEYEEGISKNLLANFLIIEEPEAHIHTHIQKSLFSNLKNNKTQVFISTHSTHISSVSNISTTNVLVKNGLETISCSPSKGLEEGKINRIERFLDAIRTDVLFAKNVILIEGDAEEILIPHLVKNTFGVTLDELGISLISVRGTGFELLSSLFHTDRIKKKCAILTDDDINLYGANKPDYLSQEEYNKAVKSAESGAARKAILDEIVRNNNFIRAYYSKFTFEIDLVLSGAVSYFDQIADESFEKKAFYSPYQEAFSSSDRQKIGCYALKLANKHKKGWFAMMLVDKLDSNFPIPDALCHSLGFTGDFNKFTLAKMVRHRVEVIKNREGESLLNNILGQDDLAFVIDNLDAALAVFKEHYPSDPLTFLLEVHYG
ncbi:ATP-dependent nuclease [Kosakonia cowanii]|uniref:ATP-dependent nuclease n=1 Tax=Kosakonia cowanii TaxID=208223 RepID=UPI00320A6AB3